MMSVVNMLLVITASYGESKIIFLKLLAVVRHRFWLITHMVSKDRSKECKTLLVVNLASGQTLCYGSTLKQSEKLISRPD